jgi:hypothetical protein
VLGGSCSRFLICSDTCCPATRDRGVGGVCWGEDDGSLFSSSLLPGALGHWGRSREDRIQSVSELADRTYRPGSHVPKESQLAALVSLI